MINNRQPQTSFLGSNLDFLLKKHKLDLKNLSLATGVSVPTLVRMKRAKSNPTVSSLEPILDFFRVDAQSILYEDMSSTEYQQKQKMKNFLAVPVYSFEDFIARKKSNVIQFMPIVGVTAAVFGININNDSLTPAFSSNATIFIDPHLRPAEGDYVLCKLGGDLTPVFRQLFMDGKKFFFRPIKFGEISHYEHYEILGVVIKSIASFR